MCNSQQCPLLPVAGGDVPAGGVPGRVHPCGASRQLRRRRLRVPVPRGPAAGPGGGADGGDARGGGRPTLQRAAVNQRSAPSQAVV